MIHLELPSILWYEWLIMTTACYLIWSFSPLPPQKKGYRLVSFPILEKSGRRASPSAYDDDSVKKRHNDMPIGNEVYLNKAPLGIEAPFLHCVMRHKWNNGAKLLVMPLEQFFQRFLLFNSDNAVFFFFFVDASSEHQFNDITDAAVVAVSNSTYLVNRFFVTDGIETHLVRLGCCDMRCRWFCFFLIDIGCHIYSFFC